jgi:hypothetical protein
MTLTVKVEVAFGTLPGDGIPPDALWTDVTAFCRKVSIRTGRSQDLDRVEAGTLTVEFDNTDSRFTPGNGQSPYDPILPFAQIRATYLNPYSMPTPLTLGASALGQASATLYDTAGAVVPLFYGFVERWIPTGWNPAGGLVTCVASDAFRYLSHFEFGLGALLGFAAPQEIIGARIARLLATIGCPFPYEIEQSGGMIASTAVVALAGPLLDYLVSIAYLDGGLFRPREDGTIEFRSLATIQADTAYTTVQETLGDIAGEHRYLDLQWAMDEQVIVNRTSGSLAGGSVVPPQIDSLSQMRYLVRPVDFGATALVDEDDLAARFGAELDGKASERLVVDAISYQCADPAVDSRALVDLAWNSRVRVRRRPDKGMGIQAEYLVQGFSHDITPPMLWLMQLRLSSAGQITQIPGVGSWILGTGMTGYPDTLTWTLDTSALDTGTSLGAYGAVLSASWTLDTSALETATALG